MGSPIEHVIRPRPRDIGGFTVRRVLPSFQKPMVGPFIMLIKTLVALAVIVVVFAAIVAMQPSEFRVARTASISAPGSVVFAQVNDFHKWRAWSPYDKLDPAMKKTYEGASAGTGAIYAWVGNSQAGEGRATITESRPNDLIRIKLDFVRPSNVI